MSGLIGDWVCIMGLLSGLIDGFLACICEWFNWWMGL
jgi:hypothetical protein